MRLAGEVKDRVDGEIASMAVLNGQKIVKGTVDTVDYKPLMRQKLMKKAGAPPSGSSFKCWLSTALMRSVWSFA